jgi:hypothetical protein
VIGMAQIIHFVGAVAPLAPWATVAVCVTMIARKLIEKGPDLLRGWADVIRARNGR